jgi:hypothetical protein
MADKLVSKREPSKVETMVS